MLTQKQENFCLAYIETGNATEAYSRSYDAKNMSKKVITNKASELLAQGDITVRIAELRKPAVEKAQITLEQHLNDLKKMRDDAWASEKYGPAIQAEIARGKASGHYIERVETGSPGDFDKVGDDELDRSISEASAVIERARSQAKVMGATQGKAKATERKQVK
jgi:phage terminase small subunit